MSNIGFLVLGGLALILLSRGVPQVGAIRPKTNQNVVGGSISRSKLTEAPDATMSSGITRGEIRGIISPPPEVQVKAAVEKINAFVETPVNKVIPQAVIQGIPSLPVLPPSTFEQEATLVIAGTRAFPPCPDGYVSHFDYATRRQFCIRESEYGV